MNDENGSGALQPTWTGLVHDNMDGLLLFEACLSGMLPHTPRPPRGCDHERIIKSGSVFIFEKNASGIEHWTDGIAWSPSCMSGKFPFDCEEERPFLPDETQRAMKDRRHQELEGTRGPEEKEVAAYAIPPSTPPLLASPAQVQGSHTNGTQYNGKETECHLMESPADDHDSRLRDLVKKTMAISCNGVSHHLVSYCTIEDASQGRLSRPRSDSRLTGLTVRSELSIKQDIRALIKEAKQCAGGYGCRDNHRVSSPAVAEDYPIRPVIYGASDQSMYNIDRSHFLCDVNVSSSPSFLSSKL